MQERENLNCKALLMGLIKTRTLLLLWNISTCLPQAVLADCTN